MTDRCGADAIRAVTVGTALADRTARALTNTGLGDAGCTGTRRQCVMTDTAPSTTQNATNAVAIIRGRPARSDTDRSSTRTRVSSARHARPIGCKTASAPTRRSSSRAIASASKCDRIAADNGKICARIRARASTSRLPVHCTGAAGSADQSAGLHAAGVRDFHCAGAIRKTRPDRPRPAVEARWNGLSGLPQATATAGSCGCLASNRATTTSPETSRVTAAAAPSITPSTSPSFQRSIPRADSRRLQACKIHGNTGQVPCPTGPVHEDRLR